MGAVVAAGAQDRVRFSADIVTNAPLLEHPKVCFSQYLGDRQRVFRALYPDQKRSERIDDVSHALETWRIYMLPLSFFLLSVRPVVDMRIWLDERQPVDAVPGGGEPVRVLSMQAVRWELRGVEVAATDFRLGVKGALMSSGQPGARRLRGSMQVAVSLAIPPVLALIPRGSIEAVGSTLLTQLLQSMKETVNRRLLLDYNQYAQEMAQTVASGLPKAHLLDDLAHWHPSPLRKLGRLAPISGQLDLVIRPSESEQIPGSSKAVSSPDL
eukprot:SM000091S24647  [mRNA]  locus=s91:406538:409551:- [translate_table: standard]